MIGEISNKSNALSIVLDAKKCATMKNTIELIQLKLKMIFGVQVDGDATGEPGDKRQFNITELPDESSSEEEEDKDDGSRDEEMVVTSTQIPEQLRNSSNFCSTIQDPSICVDSSRKPSNIYGESEQDFEQSMAPPDPRQMSA